MKIFNLVNFLIEVCVLVFVVLIFMMYYILYGGVVGAKEKVIEYWKTQVVFAWEDLKGKYK